MADAMEPLERVDDPQAERRHQRVVDPRVLEVEAEPRRARHAAQPAFATGERRPAKGDRIGQRRQREREQRKIDAAPAQHDERNRHGGDQQERDRRRDRPQHRAGKPVPLRQCGGIRAQAEPRTVAERHQPCVTDQDVERHAGDGEDHDVGGAGERQPAGEQRERQHGHCGRRDQDGRADRSGRPLIRTAGFVRRRARAAGPAARAPSAGTSTLRPPPDRNTR